MKQSTKQPIRIFLADDHPALRAGLAPDGKAVRFTVGDNGCGIPEELRERIFEPFVGSKREGGMGLGPMMLDGVKKLAPTGVMLMFAILYFGLMIDAVL